MNGQSIVNKIYNHLISQKYYEKVRALADARSESKLFLTKQNRLSFVMIRSKTHTTYFKLNQIVTFLAFIVYIQPTFTLGKQRLYFFK